MTVNTYLIEKASSLVLSSSEKASIQLSLMTLNQRLKNHFGRDVVEYQQFGSSKRGTMLPRRADMHSDVDYMVVFRVDYGDEKRPQTYLDRLKRFTETSYSRSEIHQSSPTIVLSLNHVNFELVPALAEPVGYKIIAPRSFYQDWTVTYPLAADAHVTEKNKQELNQIKPLIRLIKYWNAKNGYPFASFELEQAVLQTTYLGCITLAGYFHHFWESFMCPYPSAQLTQQKVQAAKNASSRAKELTFQLNHSLAEGTVKRIIPEY